MNAEIKPNVTTEAEPTSALTPVPLWLVSATLLLLCGSGVMFDRQSGWFDAKVYQPYKSVDELAHYQPKSDNPLPRGKAVFDNVCAVCHNGDGQGKPGQFPPLAGSEWVTTEGVNRIIRIPLVGLSGPMKVKGQDWNNSMTAVGAVLSDSDLAAALSYVRNSWGNKGSFVTPEEVKKIRAEVGNRVQPYTADELMKLPE
jgi:mono/diheme cytochrome c family protein